MTLSTKQRTKINAALCLIHDNGYDAKAVIQLANQLKAGGLDTRSAYERSLNEYLASKTDLMPVVAKVLRLVEASDDGTVDQYDAALSEYVATGDDSGLSALAPTIAKDSLALAVRDGEITAEEASSGALSKALGFEPGALLLEAVATNDPAPDSDQPPTTEQPQSQPAIRPTTPQIGAGQPSSGPDSVNTSQVSYSASPTGMRGPKAQLRWERETAPAQAIVAQAT